MDWLPHIISNVFVASLIGCLAWLIGRSGEQARIAHVLWVVCFVKLVTPPLVLLPISVPQHWVPSAQQADTVSEEMMFATEGSAVARNPTDTQGARSAASTSQYSLRSATNECWNPVHVAMGVWLGGMLWMLGRGFIRFYRFHRMLQREGCVDNAAAEFVAQLVSSRAGNGRRRFSPDVLRVPVRVSPMLFGFGHRPVILCPDQLWTSLNAAEQQSFLAHGTAHFCRRDHWVRWIEWFVTAIYWWFPGVYVARRHLERNEEACCDAWAVQQLKSPPRQYAEALLKVVDFISEHRAGIPQFASGMLPTDSLEERLRLVMQSGTRKPVPESVKYSSMVVGTVLFLLHPIPIASGSSIPAAENLNTKTAVAAVANQQPLDGEIPPSERVELPLEPQGFWNRKPRQQWADFSLSLPGAGLSATASRGISSRLYVFAHNNLRITLT